MREKGNVRANLTKIEKTPFDERRNLCDANDVESQVRNFNLSRLLFFFPCVVAAAAALLNPKQWSRFNGNGIARGGAELPVEFRLNG